MAYVNYKKKAASPDSAAALSELKERIKQKNTCGIFLFHGEEEYMKRFYFGELKKASGDADSNATVIDSDTFSLEKLLDSVNTVAAFDYSDSFFADEEDFSSSVRVIKLVDCDLSKLSEREKSALFELFASFPSGVCLVFYYAYNPKKEKDHAKSYKILGEAGGVLELDFPCEAPTSPLLKKWVKRHFDSKKCPIDAAGIDYFIEAVGNQMSSLYSEIEKLCAFLSTRENKTVYIADIDYVCIRTAEARLDDVSRGALEGDYARAISAFSVLKAEKVQETYIFGAISNKISELCTVEYYRNLGVSQQEICAKTGIRDFVVRNDFRLLDSLSKRPSRGTKSVCDRLCAILSEYDTKIKSAAGDKYLMLENMIIKICRA